MTVKPSSLALSFRVGYIPLRSSFLLHLHVSCRFDTSTPPLGERYQRGATHASDSCSLESTELGGNGDCRRSSSADVVHLNVNALAGHSSWLGVHCGVSRRGDPVLALAHLSCTWLSFRVLTLLLLLLLLLVEVRFQQQARQNNAPRELEKKERRVSWRPSGWRSSRRELRRARLRNVAVLR